MNHTPGPWHCDKSCNVTTADGSTLLLTGVALTAGNHERESEAVANTVLISSAPDLLAALEAMKDALAECEKWSLDQQIAYGKAHLAIGKARGQ